MPFTQHDEISILSTRSAGWWIVLITLIYLSLSTAGTAYATSPYHEMGLPFLTVFYPDDYNGMGQNWDVVQDDRGLIYLANGDGVFEFDGVSWRWIEPENNRTARSLDAGPGHHLYVGYHNELGYYTPDSTGSMHYYSLTAQLPEATARFRDIWSTLVHDNYVYFCSLSHIFRWEITEDGPVEGSLSVVLAPKGARFQGMTVVRDKVVLVNTAEGVQELTSDSLVTIIDTGSMNLRPIWSVLPHERDGYLLLGYEGISRYDGDRLQRWNTEVANLARKMEAYSASYLGDGIYALGTDNDGLVVFNESGDVLRVLGRDHGLPNNQVFNYPYLDREGGVWLCLDYGLARIEVLSGLQRFDHTLGLRGGVLAVERFNDDLLIGTSQGLFLPQKPKATGYPYTFATIDSITSVWSMDQYRDQLVIADENNVVVTRDVTQPPTVVLADVGPFAVEVDTVNGRAFVGGAAGSVHSLLYRRGQWVHEGELTNLIEDVNWLKLAPDGALWATFGFDTLRYARMEIDGNVSPARLTNTRLYSPANGYMEAVPGSPFEWGGDWLVPVWKGMYRWDTELDSLVVLTDHPLAELAATETINLPKVARKNHLWFENSDGAGRLAILQKSGEVKLYSPLRRTPSTGYNMFAVENGTLWAGMVGLHLLRFDLDALDHQTPTVSQTLIRSVLSDTTLLHTGATANLDFSDRYLPYHNNRIRIQFALPCYDDITRNEYQTRLLGLDSQWSEWGTDTYQQFNNLPPNTYRFEVRGRDVNGRTGIPATVSFRILPPWYATWWAILVWIALSAGTGYGIVRWRISTIEQRNLRLDQLVRQRTEELDRVRLAEREAEIKASQMETAYKMAATIAHEFNNPLAIIHASSQLMQKDEFDEIKLREFARKIPPQVLRLRDLLQRILTVEELKEIDYAAGMTILDIHGEGAGVHTRNKQENAAMVEPEPEPTTLPVDETQPSEDDKPATSSDIG